MEHFVGPVGLEIIEYNADGEGSDHVWSVRMR